MQNQIDIAVIGLAVMGKNLILNMIDNGFTVAVYNRTKIVTEKFLQQHSSEDNKKIIGFQSLELMVKKLQKPRKILLMVRSGNPTDNYIQKLITILSPGDVIVDGGNANFLDTENRIEIANRHGIYLVGMGISGGEKGARFGPSITAGGNYKGWEKIESIFNKISAKKNGSNNCCQWIDSGGSGHFIKMVHNGIEYSNMSLICEIYQFMKIILNLNNKIISEVFSTWNKTLLKSYLIEITGKILKFKNKDEENFLVDEILDIAEQKGTGRWAATNALDLNVPFILGTTSVFARYISLQKSCRVIGEKIYAKKTLKIKIDDTKLKTIIEDLKQSLIFGSILAYAEGYELINAAKIKYNWKKLDSAGVASVWQKGCIIRSSFLEKIEKIFRTGYSKNLIFYPDFQSLIQQSLCGVRNIIVTAVKNQVSLPVLSSGLQFFDTYTTESLPMNLMQAQRDYFGSHGYKKITGTKTQVFHSEWQ